MKNTMFQRVSSFVWASALLGVPLIILMLAGPAAGPAAENNDREAWGWSRAPQIVGTWITTATLAQPVPPGFPPDGKFEAVETFYSDGTMNVVSQLPGATIGAGVWKQTGIRRYTFTFSFYRLDTSTGDPFSRLMLGARVMENVLMAENGNSYITTDVISPMNGNLTTGSPLAFFPGTVKATRYEFSTFNQVLPQ